MPKNLFEKIWDATRGRRRPDLHRPPPGPRGHLSPGLRRAAPRRPEGAPPRQDPGHGRPQRPDGRHPDGAADRGRALARAGGGAGAQLRGVRDSRLFARLRPARHRPRDRPGAGRHPARHDDRLRRLSHLDSRRLRGPRLRHRHLGGRARSRHPVPDAATAEDDADRLPGRAWLRRHCQGPDPGDDRPARRRRHAGLRRRVRGPRDRGALGGEPDDDLQHDDRGRRARRHDRP